MSVARRSAIRLLSSSAIAVLAAASASAQTTPCPANFTGYAELSVGKSVSCACSQEQIRGSVWGTDRYSADSSICAAARHAGVIGAAGAKVTAYRQASCPALTGSTRNGVASSDWGAYEVTFAFSHPAPSCTPTARSGVSPCPSSMKDHEARRTGDPLECSCTAAQIKGSVWGSDRYTFDSSVCAAARHAGAVPASGGNVLVFTAGSCDAMHGSARNGVTSSDWGPYKNTFAFGYPLPRCDGSGN
jgi:hypothetical protein